MVGRMIWMAAVVVAMVVAMEARAADTAVDAVRVLVKDGQYPAALQRIAATLSLTGPAAAGVNKYELYMLKAECHLHTKQATLASDAYDKAATATKSEDPRSIALAHALLVKRSQEMAYKPKPAPAAKPGGAVKAADPIDIVDAEMRKRAFAALFKDEMAANDAKFKAAEKAKALPPILEALKTLSTLQGIELSATGDAPKSKEMLKTLAEHTRQLLSTSLADISKRVSAIDRQATAWVEFTYEATVPYKNTAKVQRTKAWKRKGLTDSELSELKGDGATCDKIPAAVAMIAESLKTDAKEFAQFDTEAARIKKEIGRLLDIDYQQVSHTAPK